MKTLIISILGFGSQAIAFFLKRLDAPNRAVNVHLNEYGSTKIALQRAVRLFEMYDRYEAMPVNTKSDIKRRNVYYRKIKEQRKKFRRLLAKE